MRSGKERVFCAGANIRMLASATHAHKVNFCKFTNETRNGIEDASAFSDQKYLCVVNGTAAGGGYELALACDHIMLVDDGSATRVLLALYGWRSYFLYAPLAFLIGAQFRYEDVLRVARWTLVL